VLASAADDVLDDVPDPAANTLAVVAAVERAVAVPLPAVVAVARRVVELDVRRAVVVADAVPVGRLAVVGRTVPLGRGRVGVAVSVGPLLEVGPLVEVGPVVAVGVVVVTVRKLFTISELQITVAPPPLPEPTHWSMVTGSAAVEVDAVTVHRTRRDPPPPFPDWLHWVMVALLVTPIGLQAVVGWVPPPVPDALHWLIDAGTAVPLPVMLLVTRTEHVTVPPPPLPEPLHWVTDVASCVDAVVLLVQVGGACAAPWQLRTVTLELVTPVAISSRLVIVTSHSTAWPPTLSVPLH
jgi:hypothetical protein